MRIKGDAASRRHRSLWLQPKRCRSKIYVQPRPTEAPDDYPESGWPLWFVSWAFVHNRAFGGLFLLGLIADVVLQRFVL